MKNWVIRKVDWAHHLSAETDTVLTMVACSDDYQGDRPDAEINHQLSLAFKRYDTQHEWLQVTRHPFAPYLANGKLYPLIEIVEP